MIVNFQKLRRAEKYKSVCSDSSRSINLQNTIIINIIIYLQIWLFKKEKKILVCNLISVIWFAKYCRILKLRLDIFACWKRVLHPRLAGWQVRPNLAGWRGGKVNLTAAGLPPRSSRSVAGGDRPAFWRGFQGRSMPYLLLPVSPIQVWWRGRKRQQKV